MNLVEPLRRIADEHPERIALIFVGTDGGTAGGASDCRSETASADPQGGDRCISFAQLDAWSARFAGGLAALGVGEGTRVVILAPLMPELYAGLIALWRLGAVAVFLDPWSGRAALEAAADLAAAEVLIAGRAVSRLRRLSPALRRIPLVLPVDGRGPNALSSLMRRSPALVAMADLASEHPALITFSSGSSAGGLRPPKAVIRSHGILEAQHQAIARALPQQVDDVDLTPFPMLVLHNLAGGVPTVILRGRNAGRSNLTAPAAVLAAMERSGCTTAVAAPAFWRELAEAAIAARHTLALRRIAVGGAVVGAPLLELLARAAPKAEVVAVYGSSEVEPVAVIAADQVMALAPWTAAGAGAPLGPPVPEVAVRILDADGAALPDGQPGELCVAGGHVAGAYLGDPPDGSGRRYRDADGRLWHGMGDHGYRDADGRLWLLGRTHTVLRRAGRSVHPVAVEAAVELLPFVERAVLASIPFLEQLDGDDERVILTVQLRQDEQVRPDWPDQIRRRVSGLAREPAEAGDEGESWGARLGLVFDEIVVVDLVDPLPMDARHRSRVDHARLRRRLIDRHRSRHLRAWLAERFPPLQYGLLISSYFGANALLAQAASGRTPLSLGWREAAGALVLLCMFFLLRIIDEHKDFAADLRVHPRRVLSRGLVTLGQLRVLGAAALVLEIGLAWALGLSAVVGCLWVLGITVLIARDFFLERFLEARMLLGALLHLLIMPLYSLFIFAAVSGRDPWAAPAPVLAYAWVGYAVALAYELARKTRTPGEERPGLVTYSRRMGPYRPAWLALTAIAAAAAISWQVGAQMGLERWYHGTVLGLLALVATGVLDYRFRPSPARAARLKDYTGLYIVAFDVLLAVALARVYGLRIG